MYRTGDTIAAISSAIGGAVAVLRVSGPRAFQIVQSSSSVVNRSDKKDKIEYALMNLSKFIISPYAAETVFIVFFRKPRSYTGEDLVEIHCHGGKIVTEKILNTLIDAGARMAEPGEFTFRAFINGKLDLSQAEAVADIINAKSELALELAERQLEGSLKRKIEKIRNELAELLSLCETELDFSEDNDIQIEQDLPQDAVKIVEQMKDILETARDGMIIRDGFKIVIAGHPNAGKSSLFNSLLSKDRAIVTDIPGTTRDTIEEDLMLGSIRATLIDTAGLREADNVIEKLGIQRSKKSIDSADMILWLLDPLADKHSQIKQMHGHCPVGKFIPVWNKSDLLIPVEQNKLVNLLKDSVCISCKNNQNIDRLKQKIIRKADIKLSSRDEFAVNSRQQQLLSEALNSLSKAIIELRNSQYETASPLIRKSISALNRITGEEFSQDILQNIFSRFCIGK